MPRRRCAASTGSGGSASARPRSRRWPSASAPTCRSASPPAPPACAASASGWSPRRACRPCRCCWSTRTGRSRPPRCSAPSARCPRRRPNVARRLPTGPACIDWLRARANHLEAPARRLLPAIDEVLAALAAQPGCALARMSGSGATCFGLFADCRRPRPGRDGAAARPAGLVDRRRRHGCLSAGPRLSSRPLGASPSGKAPDFGSGIRRFESCRPSQPVCRQYQLLMAITGAGSSRDVR